MKKLIYRLVCIYFFVCPLENMINTYTTSSNKYVGLLIVVVSFAYFFTTRYKFQLDTYIMPQFLWIAMCILSFLWCEFSNVTVSYFTMYVEMLILVYIITRFGWKGREIVGFLRAIFYGGTISALLLVLYGSSGILGGRTLFIVAGRTMDANQNAGHLLSGLIAGIYIIISSKKRLGKLLYVGIELLICYALFITGSRGGLVGAAIGFLAYFINERKTFSRTVTIIFVSSIVVLISLNFIPQEMYRRLFTFSEYEGGSMRVTYWTNMLRTVDVKWVIGHGVGSTLTFALRHYGRPIGTHNIYLLIIYEVGIIGFIFFITTYIRLAVDSYKGHYAVFFALLGGAMAASFFLDTLNTRYIWNAMILAICILNAQNIGDDKEQIQTNTHHSRISV